MKALIMILAVLAAPLMAYGGEPPQPSPQWIQGAAQTLQGQVTVPYSVTVNPRVQLDVQATPSVGTTQAPSNLLSTLPPVLYFQPAVQYQAPAQTIQVPVQTQTIQVPVPIQTPSVNVQAPGVQVQVPSYQYPCPQGGCGGTVYYQQSDVPEDSRRRSYVGTLTDGRILWKKEYPTPIRTVLLGRYTFRGPR